MILNMKYVRGAIRFKETIMNTRNVSFKKLIYSFIRLQAILVAICLILAAAVGCKPKKVPLVEFDGRIYARDGISVNAPEYSAEVRNWLSSCETDEESTITTFVLCYKEELSAGNYRFHYIIYRRLLEKKAELAVKTLRDDKNEVVELNYFFVNGTATPDVLTYVCYESTQKPVLDIIATDSTSTSEYRGYIETTAYEPFGITVNADDFNEASTAE